MRKIDITGKRVLFAVELQHDLIKALGEFQMDELDRPDYETAILRVLRSWFEQYGYLASNKHKNDNPKPKPQ